MARKTINKKNNGGTGMSSFQLNAEEILLRISDAYISLDRDSNFTFLNSKAEEILQRSADDLIGKNVWEEFPEEGEKPFRKAFDQAIEKMETVSVESYYSPLGKWVEVRVFPDENGITVFFRDITSRKSIETELKKSAETVENYFNNSGIMVWEEDFSGAKSYLKQILDQGEKDLKKYLLDHPEKMLKATSKIRVLKVNNASLEFYGADSLEELNPTLADWFMPESWPVFADELAHLMSGGLSYQNEIRVKSPKGEYFDLLFNVTVPPEYEKNLERVLVSFMDITRMRNMEQDMDFLRSRMDAAIRIGKIGFWDWDIKNDVVFWSDRMYEIYQVDKKTELKYNTVLNRVHPDDRDFHNQLVEQRIRDKDNSPFEYRVLWPDGTVKFVLVQMEVLDNENGEAVQFRGTVIDITEKKKAEQRLKQSEEKYRTLIERVSDAFVALDKNWNYTYVNKLAGEIFGRDPESLIGKNIWTEFPEGVGQPFYKAYYKAIETQTYQVLEEYYPPWEKYFENHIYPSPDGLSIYFKDITEKKNTELSLRKSNQRNLAFLNALPDLIFILNREGVYLDYQIPGEITTYKPPDEFLGKKVTDLLPPELAQEVMNNLKEVFDRGKVPVHKYRLDYPEGQNYFEARYAIINKDEVLVIVKDITDQHKTEEKIIEYQKQLQFITDESPFFIALCDTEKRYRFVNKPYAEMFGRHSAELVGLHVRDILGEKVFAAASPFMDNALSGKKTNYEFDLSAHFNEPRIFNVNYVPEKNNEGKVTGFIAAISDITEIKKFQSKLQEQQNQLRLFLENSPVSLVMLDNNMRYLQVSNRWIEDYKLGRIDIIGKSYYEVFPEIPEHWKEVHKRCLAGASEKNEEELFKRADGTEEWIFWEIHPWYKKKDEVGGIIIFSMNISERKRAEEKIIQLNRDLEQRVLERTAELKEANEELQEMNDLFVGNEVRILELKEELKKREQLLEQFRAGSLEK